MDQTTPGPILNKNPHSPYSKDDFYAYLLDFYFHHNGASSNIPGTIHDLKQSSNSFHHIKFPGFSIAYKLLLGQKMMEQTLKLLFVLYCMILVMSYHHQITLKFRQRYLDLILV